MDEKQEYAEMLEIPVNTCKIATKHKRRGLFKKRNKVGPEQLKSAVIERVNEESSLEKEKIEDREKDLSFTPSTVVIKDKKTKKKHKLSFIAIGSIAVCLLVVAIVMTNIFIPTSGINTFISSVFGQEKATETVDSRVYSDFNLTAPVGGKVENGVISLSKGGVYSLATGKVKSISKNADGTYCMEVIHNDNFSTIINNLTYCYFSEGEEVYTTIPVGYTNTNNATMCFCGQNGETLVNFTFSDGSILWEA